MSGRVGCAEGGLDTETLARLPDGRFLIGEEYGSSLVEVAADGTITKRLRPAGLEGILTHDAVEVVGLLPAIIAKRCLNCGIGDVAVSAYGRIACLLMQSPSFSKGRSRRTSENPGPPAEVRSFELGLSARPGSSCLQPCTPPASALRASQQAGHSVAETSSERGERNRGGGRFGVVDGGLQER